MTTVMPSCGGGGHSYVAKTQPHETPGNPTEQDKLRQSLTQTTKYKWFRVKEQPSGRKTWRAIIDHTTLPKKKKEKIIEKKEMNGRFCIQSLSIRIYCKMAALSNKD